MAKESAVLELVAVNVTIMLPEVPENDVVMLRQELKAVVAKYPGSRLDVRISDRPGPRPRG